MSKLLTIELTEEDELWIPKLRATNKITSIAKHPHHSSDQSGHGNWARGGAVKTTGAPDYTPLEDAKGKKKPKAKPAKKPVKKPVKKPAAKPAAKKPVKQPTKVSPKKPPVKSKEREGIEERLGFTENEYGELVNADDRLLYEFEQGVRDDWMQWQECRDIRNAAADIAGVQDEKTFEATDPHSELDATEHGIRPSHGGQVNPDDAAQYLMESLVGGEKYWDLHRAIGMLDAAEMDAFLALARPGATFDAPLLSFANMAVLGESNILDRFGTDILLKVEGSATGHYTGMMQEPVWTQRDEDTWLRDTEIQMLDGYDEVDDPEGYASAVDLKDAIHDHLSGTKPIHRESYARFEIDQMYGGPENTFWAGSPIDEQTHQDEYYAQSDDAYGYSPDIPGEVVSGGRFKVKSAEPGSGEYEAWTHVITIEQVGVFDPQDDGTLVMKMVKAKFVLDAGPLTDQKAAAKRKKKRPESKIAKHPHKDGSSQDKHGRKGSRGPTKTQEDEGGAVPIEDRVREWRTKDLERFNGMWNRGEDVRGNTDAGIAEVWDRMQKDPRWEEAAAEFDMLPDDAPMFDEVYQEAEDLVANMWGAAQDMGATWNDMDSTTTPWFFMDYMDTHVMNQGEDVVDFGIDGFEEIEELEDMIGETVYTTEEATPSITDTSNSYYHEEELINERFELLSFDPETGMVRLERQARINDVIGDGLGPVEGRGGLLGGEGGMGPEVIEVGYKTLMADHADEHGFEHLVMEGKDRDATYARLVSLDEQFDFFHDNYAVSPQDAMSTIEMGDYSPFSGNLDPGQSTGLVVNDSYGSSGISIATKASEVPMHLRNLWANTSADEHRWAIAMQRATAVEFGLDTVPMDTLSQRTGNVAQEAVETYDQFGTGLQVYARAVYDTTQDYLAEQVAAGKIDSGPLPVVRGMGLSRDVYVDHYAPTPVNRGTSGVKAWTPVEVTLNPLSSFSTSVSVARNFASRANRNTRYSSLTRAYVPQSQIWGLSQLGHGSYRESEVIVLGGDDSLIAEMSITE